MHDHIVRPSSLSPRASSVWHAGSSAWPNLAAGLAWLLPIAGAAWIPDEEGPRWIGWLVCAAAALPLVWLGTRTWNAVLVTIVWIAGWGLLGWSAMEWNWGAGEWNRGLGVAGIATLVLGAWLRWGCSLWLPTALAIVTAGLGLSRGDQAARTQFASLLISPTIHTAASIPCHAAFAVDTAHPRSASHYQPESSARQPVRASGRRWI